MSSNLKHPLGYDSKTAKVSSGHHYRYVDIHPPQGVKTIVTALVLHGFPDSAYGWRHQVKGWSQRGIRLIVPDTLGYTGSSQPTNPEEYSLKTQSEDLSELVHIAGVPKDEKIILIAHDWGAGIANRLSQFKPELVKGAANLCVPFSAPPLQYMTIEQYVERLPNFQYQLFFASPRSNAIIDSNLEKFMNLIYASAKQYASGEAPPFEKEGVVEAWLKDDSKSITSALLSEEEFSTIVSQIKSGVGFSAMLNYYRTRKINYELEKDLPQDYRPDMPKLMVVPSADPAIPAALSAYAEKQLKAVEVAWLEGLCGHWVQLEKPEEVERVVGDWVERMHAKGWEA